MSTLSLSSYTSSARLSEETLAFATALTFNGKVVGEARNSGQGGAHMIHLNALGRGQITAIYAASRALVTADPTFAEFLSPDDDDRVLDLAVDVLTNQRESDKEEKRYQKSLDRAIAKTYGRPGNTLVAVARTTSGHRILGFRSEAHYLDYIGRRPHEGPFTIAPKP